MTQILNFIEEQARRKFQEKLKSYQSKPLPPEMEDEMRPPNDRWLDDNDDDDEFSYNMPAKGRIPAIDEPFDFGVAPNDPRFYENAMKLVRVQGSSNRRQMDEEGNSMDGGAESSNEGPYLRIKDPLIVNPKPNPDSFYKAKEMQGLLHKWGRNNVVGGSGGVSGVGGVVAHGQEVVQRPVNLAEQSPFSIYGVALIAGVSAAISTRFARRLWRRF